MGNQLAAVVLVVEADREKVSRNTRGDATHPLRKTLGFNAKIKDTATSRSRHRQGRREQQ
jgi:hypothetical protein